MRIVFVCGFAWEPKGTARARAHPLAAELVRRGHQVTLLLVPYDNPQYSARAYELDGVQVRNLALPGNSHFAQVKLAVDLCRAIDAHRPDLLHVFKPKGFAGIACAYQLLKERHAVVLDCDDWEGWGGWNEFARYSWIVKQYIDLQEKSLIRRTPVVTAASRVLADRARELRRGDRVYYLPNCLTPQRATEDEELSNKPIGEERRTLGLPEGRILLYAGHYEGPDDLGFFCRATAPVARALDVTVLLAGDGPQVAEVQGFFHQHQVRHIRLGQLPLETYRRVLHASDVACFPFPNHPVYGAKCSARILDFMSLGKAILTSAVGQNLEYLAHGESAMLAPAGDVECYQRYLAQLLEDPQLRNRLAANAQIAARTRFLWDGPALESCLAAYAQALVSSGTKHTSTCNVT